MKLLRKLTFFLADMCPLILAGAIIVTNLRVREQSERSNLLMRGYLQLHERLSVTEKLVRPATDENGLPLPSDKFREVPGSEDLSKEDCS